jgi:ABC-type transport system involved in multi-copper enzyme maturation permease subunit
MRWGLGPVFLYECLTSSRRWQTYALRSLGVAALLIAMSTIAMSNGAMFQARSSREYARLGVSYFYGMIGVELALVMLVAPAATAGAICLDRARGTLAHMLMTDLSDTEIVLGKLAARLMPVMGLVACSWPVMSISSLLGGIDPIALTLAFAIIVAMALLGCTIALTLSVWASKTHEVILSTYAVWILSLLLWPIWYGLSTGGLVGAPPDWTLLANPFYIAFAPYAFPLKLEFRDYVGFFGVTLGSSAVLCMLAVWRTRPVACRGNRDKSGNPRLGRLGRMTRWLPGPSLDRDPVLWREWHRSRPTPWMTGLVALLMGTTAVLCIVGAVAFWRNGATPRPGRIWETAGVCSYLLHVVFGLLILSAVAPTSMAEERQRGSLDILAATSLSTRAIVIGKWMGTFRLAVLMVAGPGLMALAMATARSESFVVNTLMSPEHNRPIPLGTRICGVGAAIATILAHGALTTSIGIALAVWIRRQGRAIGVSVALFILINAAWPIIANIVFSRSDYFSSRDLAALSSVALCGGFVNFFTSRQYGYVGGILWAGTFWAVEVFILAMGLLWLTIRTFDDCFDRLPDRTRRYSVQTIIAIILIGMIGGGSLIWSISLWAEGLWSEYGFSRSLPILPYTLAITIALVLIASESAKSISARLRPGAIGPGKIRTFAGPNELVLCTGVSPSERESLRNAQATIGPSRFVLGRWWRSYRLVLLLAIGPALLATSLATAQKAPRYISQTTADAMGRVTYTWTLAVPNLRHAAEVPLGFRLASVALLIVTILVHGAAGVGVGLALATTMRGTRRAIAVVAGLTLIVVFIVPLGVIILSSRRPLDTTMWSVVLASESLLDILVAHGSFHIRDILWTVLFWDVVIGLFAAGMLWLAIRIWQRRALGLRDSEPALELESKAKSLDVEAVLIAD